jgi:hypothetical protein
MALMLFGAGDAVAQSTWYGSVSTAWNNPTNWTPSWQIPGNIQSVPASGASIIIPSGCNYYPVVTNSLTIGTLTMNQGSGSFTVAAGTLTCGAISVSGGSSYNFTINSGATVASSGKVEMGSILTVNGILTASSIQQDNTSPGFTISAGGSVSSSGSVNVQGPFTVNGTLTSGGLILNNGGALTVNTSATVISSGVWAFNGGSYNIKGGNFSFSGGTESIPAGAYTSLILNGAGTDSLASGTSVSGNLSIASGTVVKVAAGVNIPVGNLTLNGVTQASGTWGYSGRTHNNTTYFANTTGYLTVANGPPASKLVYTTVPATGTAGTAFSVTVQSQDASGNPASPTSNTTITLSKASGGGVLSGTLTGTIPTSGNSVTISTPVYSKSDTMTLTATATAGETALTAVTSGGIVFSAGAATQLVFTSSPVTVMAGVASGNITVQRQDQFGNPTTTGATGVTLSSSSTGTKTFNPTSLTIASGSSSATFTYTDTHAGSPTITAAGTGLTSGTQQETVNPGAIDHYVVSATTPETAGSTFSTTVTAKDANGNTVTTDSSTAVTMTSSSVNVQFDGNGDGTFGDNTKTLSSGVFTINTRDNVAESMTITATSTGSKTGTSTGITVYAAGTWLGTTSSDWFTAANWWGGVPTSSADVLIPAMAPFQPAIDASGALCRNLTINASASLTFSGPDVLTVSGNWTNNGALAPDGGTVVFNGSSVQTIGGAAATTFNNLTLNNPGGVTASSDLTVNGVLNLSSANPAATQGSLDLGAGAAMKTLIMGGSATTIGVGEVTGIVTRTNLFPATSYTFGDQYTTINFQNTGTLPAWVSLKITIGSAPSWKTGAIQRIYELIQSGASGCYATLNAHYLDTELNGNTENNLVFWIDNSTMVPGQVEAFGRSNYELTNNWVGIAGVPMALYPSSFGQTFETFGDSAVASFTWNGSASTSWIDPLNWTPNGVPSDLSDVTIPDAATTPNDPTLPIGAATVGRLTLQSGAILNATATSTLTISGGSGAWVDNGGTFNDSTSTVIFTGATATMSGNSEFYNVTIASGASLYLDTDTVMGIGGTITNNGTWRSGNMRSSTVEYNGGDQTVLSPNGLTPGYANLVLGGSGTKTLVSTTTARDNVEIDTGVTFNLSGGGSNIVGSLTLGGVLQAVGTWGSSSSVAAHQDNTHFQGAGVLEVLTGTADHITITSSTANLGAGSPRVITAEIRDANGNIVTSDNSTSVTFAQTAGNGSVSGTDVALASAGLATRTVTGVAAGPVTITASANGLTSGTSTFNVISGAASKLVYTIVPATGTAGTAFSVTVQSQDANGNPASSTSDTTITLNLASGGGILSGILTGTISTSGNSVTISTPVYSKPDTLTLTATATAGETALTAVTSGGIVFSAGAATQLAFTSTAATTTAGVASGSITVQRQDFFGNANTTDATRLVTLASTSTGTVTFIPASLSIASGSSSATFTYTDTQAGTPTITASGSGLTSGTQQETVNQLSTSVAVSSSENPSGYKDSVSFTATLPSAATGNVIFMINSVALSTNVISSGAATSAATTLLSRGTNIITAEYVGDENYTGSTNDLFGGQVVTNHSPVANAATYGRANGTSIKISITDLLAQFTSDADGDALSLESVAGGSITNYSVIATTTNGSDVYILNPYAGGAYIMLLPTNDLSETFSYVVNDTSYPALTATNMITVTVTNAVGQMTGSISTSGGSAVTTTWAGIPGSGYAVQRSPDLSTWADIWTTNAPPAGVFSFTDTTPPQPAAYYRLRQD